MATSIDALAVGLSLAVLEINIWYPALIIGVITSLLSFIAIRAGARLGRMFGRRMEVAGGIVLLCIGFKILIPAPDGQLKDPQHGLYGPPIYNFYNDIIVSPAIKIDDITGHAGEPAEIKQEVLMIKKDIFNHDVKAQFQASAKDKMYRFTMADGKIRGAVVHATRMVQEMRSNHNLGPLETLVLGQGYVAASLMGVGLKEKNDRLSIQIKCSGPIKGLDVECNVYGEVRGYLMTDQIEVENPDKIKYLSTLYGAGFLTVTKYLDNAVQPYSGQVALEHGSVAEDLANYFLVSEQLPTGFKLGVSFDENGEVSGAGGILLQALPGVDIDMVTGAEKTMARMEDIGKMFADGRAPEEVVLEGFSDLAPKILSNARVEFYCRCSKEKMFTYLNGLAREDRDDLRQNGPFPIEVRCHHCNSVYQFSKQEIQDIGS